VEEVYRAIGRAGSFACVRPNGVPILPGTETCNGEGERGKRLMKWSEGVVLVRRFKKTEERTTTISIVQL
jgi:hypothetical protein